jgi:tol-pal system beta propeller repeat protein TolB
MMTKLWWLAGTFAIGAFAPPSSHRAAGDEEAPMLLVSTNRFGGSDLIMLDVKGQNVSRLTKDLASVTEPNWSPAGRQIAFTSHLTGGSRLQWLDFESRMVTPFDNSPATDRNASWSPDGKKIVFTSDRGGNPDICVMDADGRNVVNLTHNPAYDADPAFSPDGTKIAFASNRSGAFRLWVMNADGKQPVDLLNADQKYALYPAWSPDGAQLVFGGRGADDTIQLFVVNADGKAPLQLTEGGPLNTYAAWSPGGEYLANARFGTAQVGNNAAPAGDLMIYDVIENTHTAILKGELPVVGPRPCWKPVVERGR